MENKLNIAVIGAGIAGLSCATALQDAGHWVQVFDKSRGVSGRMSTRRGDGWQADHGAPWFEAHDKKFREAVVRWCDAGAAATWRPRLKVLKDGVWADGNVQTHRFVGAPTMTSPARLLASRLNVKLETTIKSLTRRADDHFRWHLQSAEQGWLETSFDVAVIAIPAHQATLLLVDIGHPFGAQAKAVLMQGCWALMLQFAEPIELGWDAAQIHDGMLCWAARDSAKPGRQGAETWVLHASAAWSEANMERPATEIAEAMLGAFREIGGPQPIGNSAHRWRYAGCVAGGGEASVSPALWDDEHRLGVCGDWLNGGEVEGAWLSGLALANRIAGGSR